MRWTLSSFSSVHFNTSLLVFKGLFNIIPWSIKHLLWEPELSNIRFFDLWLFIIYMSSSFKIHKIILLQLQAEFKSTQFLTVSTRHCTSLAVASISVAVFYWRQKTCTSQVEIGSVFLASNMPVFIYSGSLYCKHSSDLLQFCYSLYALRLEIVTRGDIKKW